LVDSQVSRRPWSVYIHSEPRGDRHGGRCDYRATAEADVDAWEATLRSKPSLLGVNRKLQRIVASKLSLDWSPEQVSGWLKAEFPDDESMRVSHEAPKFFWDGESHQGESERRSPPLDPDGAILIATKQRENGRDSAD
jgi:hypothetical protein